MELTAKMKVMEEREQELLKRSKKLEAEAAADFLKRVRDAESSIKAIIKELQQARPPPSSPCHTVHALC